VQVRILPGAPTHGGVDQSAESASSKEAQCREPEVRIAIAASPVANFGFKAALESESC
jgi:hypothetical protein